MKIEENPSFMNAQLSATPDPFFQFKQAQKQGWAHFAPLEMVTIPQAPRLIRHAKGRSADRVLDVACGTGVVSITAARLGAHATGLDLTPELLQRARENARISGVAVEFHEGDAESLPFADGSFDVVLSQFGHMFAPRPEVAIAEMLRVLKPGGTIAFSTWPPELYVGRSMALSSKYLPPPPGMPSPMLWGDPNVVRERLGDKVKDVVFHRARMDVPVLSAQIHRANTERTVGPLIKLVEALSASAPEKLEQLRKEFEALAAEYLEDNLLRQDYLMTRATKI
jgi:ubiquinone/menaquinone biosynthesis C-methylase UbiE